MSSGRSVEGVAGGDGVGRGLAVGVAVRPLLDVLSGLQAQVDGIDPAQAPARDAVDLVRVLDRIGRVAEAAKARAAGRVAESSLWSKAGHRSPAHWVAKETGIGVGEAIKLLETAEVVAAAPVVHEALVAGVVSPRQARAAARAEAAQPGEGARLVEKAGSVSVAELETDANRIVAAASSETAEQKAERLHRKRMLRTGVDAEGMGYGHWLLEPAAHARLMALIDANKDRIFREARKAGVREPSEAYAADALAALADLPSRSKGSAMQGRTSSDADSAEGADDPAVVEDWSFTKMIVRVDLTALDRGQVAPGEVCEIAGQGPIPVTGAWRMIDGNAFVAAVTTNGTKIDKVVHLGRRPTVLQRTALEWFSAGECSTEGCTNPARIEIDHVADWADTKITRLPDLASPCGHCPRSQDPPRLHLRPPPPVREATAHPTRRRRPTRPRPGRPDQPQRRRRRPTGSLRHQLRPVAVGRRAAKPAIPAVSPTGTFRTPRFPWGCPRTPSAGHAPAGSG